MRRGLIIVLLMMVAVFGEAQELRQYEFLRQNADTLNHSSVRDLYPFVRPLGNISVRARARARARTGDLRSPMRSPVQARKPLAGFIAKKLLSENLVIIDKPGVYITGDPLFDTEIGREFARPTNTWVNTRGFQVYGKLDLREKVELVEGVEPVELVESEPTHTLTPTPTPTHTPSRPRAPVPLCPSLEFYTSYYESQARFPLYVDSLASLSGGIPGQGFILLANGTWDHSYATAWVRYTTKKFFTFEAGTGKNFFGNGYRSMLLSDNGRNYPYFRIDTRFWRVHYTNLWAEFQDNNFHDGPLGSYQKKYGAFHYLSLSITKRLEFSLFEAIIWQGRDSLHNRGFEVNYLNPVIFLRPVEWTLGSPDNALIGMNLSYKLFNDTYLYSQLLVDDFPISHLKARDGYWGNKLAGQLGAKAYVPLGHWSLVTGHSGKKVELVEGVELVERARGLFLQSELNIARPYTYAHWTTKQNYGHVGQPLAHPLGSNFYEWVSFARLNWDRFLVEGRYSLAKFGANYDGLNYGQDIFISFENRVNELGNFIGQGLPTTLTYTSCTFSYLLNPSSLLNIFLTLTDRNQNDNHSLWVSFGLRNSLRNFYYDY